jgi:opacity protein-like surface antigen
MLRALNHAVRAGFLLACASLGTVAIAQAPSHGFYGGLTLRENGAEQGLAIGAAGNPDRFVSSLAPTPGSQALVFGGYRWRNDLALEAVLNSVDGYRLSGRGGVGLLLPAATDSARSWNVDLYGSWAFWRRFSLYGRLGYTAFDSTPLYSTSVASVMADRRGRDGLNYGVGLRYDVNRSLGLKLEYARVGTLALDAGSTVLPDSDQVQFGLQFRF